MSCKKKYERIKLLEYRCTELERKGLKVKNQLRTLRMKIFKETNEILNKNRRKCEKEFEKPFEESGKKMLTVPLKRDIKQSDRKLIYDVEEKMKKSADLTICIGEEQSWMKNVTVDLPPIKREENWKLDLVEWIEKKN
jgi:hypothetical protein